MSPPTTLTTAAPASAIQISGVHTSAVPIGWMIALRPVGVRGSSHGSPNRARSLSNTQSPSSAVERAIR
jgi:hypothetical protein